MLRTWGSGWRARRASATTWLTLLLIGRVRTYVTLFLVPIPVHRCQSRPHTCWDFQHCRPGPQSPLSPLPVHLHRCQSGPTPVGHLGRACPTPGWPECPSYVACPRHATPHLAVFLLLSLPCSGVNLALQVLDLKIRHAGPQSPFSPFPLHLHRCQSGLTPAGPLGRACPTPPCPLQNCQCGPTRHVWHRHAHVWPSKTLAAGFRLSAQVSIWPYTCWTPREGMSNPRLTIMTVIDCLPKRYCTADLVPYPLDSIAQVSIWPYTCWTPREGMSDPRLTIVTVIDGLPKRYRTAIWNNRMHYAARHGHRWGGASGVGTQVGAARGV